MPDRLVAAADARRIEGRHLAEQPSRSDDDRDRQTRPGCLAESEAEVEEGLQAELVEDDPVAGLCRAMAGDQSRLEPRGEASPNERRRSGDEPVQQNRDIPLSR